MREPTGALGEVAKAAGAAGGEKGLPPVHLWNPARCGDIDIRVGRDGVWLHEGRPIRRPALVRLFSTVLRKDPDGFYLVTPAEKLRITVEDAPFQAVRVDREGSALVFLTDVGDRVEAGPDHPVRMEFRPGSAEPAPYVHVRAGLDARLTRSAYYELVEMAELDGGRLVVESNGARFVLGEMDSAP